MPNLPTRQESPEVGRLDPGALALAFESFSSVADSLESSYGSLQAELSRLRSELECKNRELARTQSENERMRALAEMTALLAHEIRNPLGSLELFAGLVKEATQKDPEVSQWMVHVQAGLRALAATVNNVLHFYSQAPLQTIPINVVELLTDTMEFLQPLALQRGMGINFVNPQKEVLIDADPHRLQQVFFNVTINALRAMSAGGAVTVRVSTEKKDGTPCVNIAFEDQGCGISAENIEKIFAAGFTTKRGSPGLGLAVCKRVIEQHGGALQVTSVPGHGTTFTLTFRVCGASA
jgi:signal transduction histidine kinase